MNNKLVNVARELLNINDDISFRFDYTKDDQKLTVDDFELFMFEQTWGSTSLGFGGIGGAAMTTANTYVFVPVTCNQNCYVYFGSRYAYQAEYNNETFREDLRNRRMKPCWASLKYVTKENK